MSKLAPLASGLLLAAACCAPAGAQALRARAGDGRRGAPRAPLVILDGTRETDGLRGPVRRVETEVVRVEVRQGRAVPQAPSLLERTLYDVRGRRVENETYPVVGGRADQESHSYDARGNVVETVVRDGAGAVLSRTVYEYEFDEHGNWIRMTASVAVSNRGRTEYEPFEITRRTITYYAADDATATQGGAIPNRGGAPAAEAAARKSPATKAPPGGEVFDAGVLNERATWLPQPPRPAGRGRPETPITVAVEVVLDITGRVVSARALNGPAALRDPAERAARLAAFLPFYVSGRPVRARGVVNYDFNHLP
jgi:hypothetical protein